MTQYFLDSSSLLKRYIPETGTGWISALTAPQAGNTIFVAQIASAEIVSGISRRKREGAIPPGFAHTLRFLMDRHMEREYLVVELTPQILQQAEDLLESHPLRAYDAVQLASAISSNSQIVTSGKPPLTFVCADTRLLSIASIEGLSTDDPNAHP